MDPGTTAPNCCFNMISRWFKKRKKSMDINSNYPSCKNDFFYTNMGNGMKAGDFNHPKSKSLVCNTLIDTAKAQEVRRASILVTEPKPKPSIQYYKKRVSFADILVRKEFDAGSQSDGLHEEEDEEEADEEAEYDDVSHDHEPEATKYTKNRVQDPHSSHHRTADVIAAEALLFVS